VRRFLRPAALAFLATVGVAVALAVRPGDRALSADVYLLFLGGLVLALLLRETGRLAPRLAPSELEVALRRRSLADERPPELARLEREVEMARQTTFDTYYRLRPTLREIARHRLARRGVDLDAPGGSAETLLGEDAWALVRPDLPRPSHHFAPGATLEQVDRALDSLERLR
jgi:hypothetical protein